jgi:hypothetical protein
MELPPKIKVNCGIADAARISINAWGIANKIDYTSNFGKLRIS